MQDLQFAQSIAVLLSMIAMPIAILVIWRLERSKAALAIDLNTAEKRIEDLERISAKDVDALSGARSLLIANERIADRLRSCLLAMFGDVQPREALLDAWFTLLPEHGLEQRISRGDEINQQLEGLGLDPIDLE